MVQTTKYLLISKHTNKVGKPLSGGGGERLPTPCYIMVTTKS